MAAKKQKYEVWNQVEKKMVEVDGAPVVIEGYPNLFIHRPIDKKGEWMVSEASTGRSVSAGSRKTIPEATAHAKERLEELGPKKFKAIVDICLENGTATRWYKENGR